MSETPKLSVKARLKALNGYALIERRAYDKG
jgi:hypothetical protein